ncbi:nuclear transport factor 2 family protein [Sphingopyxis sp. OAS728]|uniref:nuclear transport factor 2 family protein n=1 Tax=Sphingopyxis sp. OAS728 TaxID=2663823 RepID=UPI00178A20F7|nr:nuclear transport factor 2 family protein [Sphingopyxis sp. OAS728]
MIVAICALILATSSGQPKAQEAAPDTAALKIATQALLDAVATGRTDIWDTYLDDRIIHVDENGVRRTKAELIAELAPLPTGLSGSLEIASFEARITNDIAVTFHEDQEQLDYHGQPLRSRFRSVDTWRRTDQGWRLIAAHVAAVQRDPPSVQLPPRVLCELNGIYRLTPEIVATLSCDSGKLRVERPGRPDIYFAAETRDIFFEVGKPRVRRIFQRNIQGRVTGFVDRREGEDIRWRRVGTK